MESYLNTTSSDKKLNYDRTREKALRLLEYRAHSEKELTDKLRRAGAVSDDIEKVLLFCREYNFINDEDYAKKKAKDLQNLKKYGKRRIYQELKQKGIAEEYIESALSELMEIDETDILNPIVKKKLNGNFEKKNIDKCIRYFMYRGYDLSDIKRSIERIVGESDEI